MSGQTPDLPAALLEGVPLPLVVLGPDARIRRANAPAAALVGADAAGRHYTTALRQPELVAAVERALAGQGAQRIRLVVTGPSRDTIYRVLVTPLAGEGVSLAFEDMSEIEQAHAMRRDFVANVSHELRTPLTALLGFIETLKGAARDDPAARLRFLTIMEREATRMNRLIADLLSLGKVEAEERVRPSQRVDVVGLAQGAVATLRGVAAAGGVDLALTAPERVEVPADADQITQVLQNLIENAIKYGGAGKRVDIEIVRTDVAALGGPAVRISVTDFGEGIAAIHLPRLTERFYRADDHRSREKGGTGLGLAIVKHIVQRHRGRLKIESEKGKGSRFTVLLPAE